VAAGPLVLRRSFATFGDHGARCVILNVGAENTIRATEL
jgi:hypothetical protein